MTVEASQIAVNEMQAQLHLQMAINAWLQNMQAASNAPPQFKELIMTRVWESSPLPLGFFPTIERP